MSTPLPPAGWHPDPVRRHQYRYWDGTAWTEHVADEGTTSTDPLGPAVAHATSSVPTTRRERPVPNRTFAVVAAVGGGVPLVVGSFLSWVEVSLSHLFVGVTASANGMDRDGPITLVLGIAVAVLAVLVAARVLPRWATITAAAAAALGAVVAVIDIVDVTTDVPEGVDRSVGVGLWVCLAGGIIGAAAATLAALRAESPVTGS